MLPLLEVTQLSLSLGLKKILKDLSFKIFQGDRLAIIGESGSGKSLTISTVARLLPRYQPWKVSGDVSWQGEDLLHMKPTKLQQLRHGGFASVFQEAMCCLNPSMKIHAQLREVQTEVTPIEWLSRVGIVSPEKVQHYYPHQLSGGMRQRVALAIALSTNPALLFADEVTSALDSHSQEHILELIESICKENNTALIFVTHDIVLAKKLCTKSCVIYQGAIVEYGDTEVLLENPKHPHTVELIKNSFL